jgi:hypothetical protein
MLFQSLSFLLLKLFKGRQNLTRLSFEFRIRSGLLGVQLHLRALLVSSTPQ